MFFCSQRRTPHHRRPEGGGGGGAALVLGEERWEGQGRAERDDPKHLKFSLAHQTAQCRIRPPRRRMIHGLPGSFGQSTFLWVYRRDAPSPPGVSPLKNDPAPPTPPLRIYHSVGNGTKVFESRSPFFYSQQRTTRRTRVPQHLGGGGGATLVLGGDHSGGGGRRPQMTQRDFPSPPLTTDYRASPEDPPPNVLATQKAGSPHPTPLLLPSHGIGFQRKEFGDFLGRKFRFEIGFVIRGKGRKKGIFGLVEIGFSKFIYVRQGCLVVERARRQRRAQRPATGEDS